MPFEIVTGMDFIQINNEDKQEVVYWISDEWHDEPDIVFSIVEAVRLALTNPDKLIEVLNIPNYFTPTREEGGK